MQIIEFLHNRVSRPKLQAPAPDREQLELMFKAALRAPDHAGLKPWRYLVYQGEAALGALGDKFAAASLADDPELPPDKLDKLRAKPLRAPMVIIAVAVYTEHRKVPHIEQILSAGAGVENLMLAANALGFGTYWRTGSLAYNSHLLDELGLGKRDTIVGFIYLGTPDGEPRVREEASVGDFVEFHGQD